MNRTPLCELAEKYGTDKGPSCHGYTRLYHWLFGSWRNAEMVLFETGVEAGVSLRMWADYFPQAQIHGLDISLERVQDGVHDHPRIHLHEGDQKDPEVIETALGSMFEMPSIVVDDASHAHIDQQRLLVNLHQRVVNNGHTVYVIEDIHTSLMSAEEAYSVLHLGPRGMGANGPVDPSTTLLTLGRLKASLVTGVFQRSNWITDEEGESIRNALDDLDLYSTYIHDDESTEYGFGSMMGVLYF